MQRTCDGFLVAGRAEGSARPAEIVEGVGSQETERAVLLTGRRLTGPEVNSPKAWKCGEHQHSRMRNISQHFPPIKHKVC